MHAMSPSFGSRDMNMFLNMGSLSSMEYPVPLWLAIWANCSVRRSPVFGNERFKPRHGSYLILDRYHQWMCADNRVMKLFELPKMLQTTEKEPLTT
jgi:hypothetical protein